MSLVNVQIVEQSDGWMEWNGMKSGEKSPEGAFNFKKSLPIGGQCLTSLVTQWNENNEIFFWTPLLPCQALIMLEIMRTLNNL